ncbi:hypothetical protein SAMN05444398_1302 [Roseovarius pacificus]|uniref:Metallo-beta-lactamase domain-containing protein n=1 Tax=Roseovarius pacificus TaxID=337701 RepID=A0A1M7KJZ4_9RHOB|nr:MBL fold metallo-hydrolase [Roseovarius pacificus]GGO62973.1 MBL fold metallo-hydrolase [Roseovarius pacificus]SHM65657.1 hypothetical protein SAMN05444398_1302 [Roseovarius pacificus]
MTPYICTTCGTQFTESKKAPAECPICVEERQFVPESGQSWTSFEKLQKTHKAAIRMEDELIGISSAPAFGIGQRALLVRTPQGNILWDCVSYLDPATIEMIKGLGGLAGIAISHPHYYTTMVEWSHAFGDVPVYLHAADREWVMRPDKCLHFWEGESKELMAGLTMVRTGGHFEGGCVLHCANLAGGKGALLAGDLLQVVADNKHLAFMRSYPNFIPLGEASVRNVARRISHLEYDAIYGAWWDRVIHKDAKKAMAVSVDRHIEWLHREV